MTQKTKMRWVDLAVIPHFSWPNKQVEIEFEGKKIVLQPGSKDLSCTVSVFDNDGLSFDEGGKIIYRFLSRLAWSHNAGIEELFIAGSNMPKRPGLLGRGSYGHSGYAQVEPWDYIYLPIPNDEEAERALAVYREAMSVNSFPYAFLGYYKVLNIRLQSPRDQKKWINSNLTEIQFDQEKKRLLELKKTESDIGAYLYDKGRCAVAHAFSKNIVNPDNYLDKKRLELDLPLMKKIAAVYIEKEFKVMSESSFWKKARNHYEGLPELLKRHQTDDDSIIYKPFKIEMVMTY